MTSPDVTSLPPREAIERWQNKQISGTGLMRCLVSYGQWMVPVSEAAVGEMLAQGAAPRLMFSRDAEGVSRLFIFSDDNAYDEYKRAAGATGEQHFLSTRGTWIFRLPMDEIDYVAIDPASAHEIAYGKNLLPRLKEMADALEVEEALLDLRAGAGATEKLLPLVLNYEGYRVGVRRVGERVQMVLAPDEKGRRLAAVFTSDEAADAYAGQVSPADELQWLRLPGAQLFEQLGGMPIDGIVFNCMGPPKPVAFAAQLAQLVLSF